MIDGGGGRFCGVAGANVTAAPASPRAGYAPYYLTRNSLTYTAPVMVATPALGMDVTQIGLMTSIFPLAYGFSKSTASPPGWLPPTLALLEVDEHWDEEYPSGYSDMSDEYSDDD